MVVRVAILDDSYTVNEPYFNGRSYVEWLESFTIDERIDIRRRQTYHKLIRELWEIDYIPTNGNDADRAAEGLELRIRYNDILAKKAGEGEFVTPDVHAIFGECRVLEMLIALSMRMYDLMQDMGLYNSVSRWFWEIMANVGFDILDDYAWGSDDSIEAFHNEDFVHDICNEIMRPSGPKINQKGGWFYLKDWAVIEIWYQMHRYLKQYVG
jgi:hypothetical protein